MCCIINILPFINSMFTSFCLDLRPITFSVIISNPYHLFSLNIGYVATNVPEENCGYCESKGLIVQDKMERVQRR